jgi:hypothetical protein
VSEKASKALSARFWTVPDGAFQHEDTKKLHTEITAFLREEFTTRQGLGTVEMMMVERTAFFYCWVRDRERSGVGTEGHTLSPEEAQKGVGFVHERNYKEATQLLTDMLSRLQRASSDTADPMEIRQEAMAQFIDVVNATIDTLPDEYRDTVRDRFEMNFGKADI